MKTYHQLFILFVTIAFSSQSYGQKPEIPYECKIIEQPHSPIKILKYKAEYKSERAVRLTSDREGIYHEIEYQNISDKPILADQMTIVMFNCFNEYLDTSGGSSVRYLEPQKKITVTLIADPLGSHTFLTGVIFVNKVRFYNGEIWRADLDTIYPELAGIDKDFQASELNQKKKSE